MKYGLSNDVISELQRVFRLHDNITEVIIFGSRAKGNFREGSDIDLAAVGHGLSFNQLLDLHRQISDIGLLYKVDIVDYEKEKETPLGRHIGRVGKLFYKA